MEIDNFTTDNFHLSYHGIDIIKNGTTHAHLDFSSIRHIELKKGRRLRYWLLSFILGIGIAIPFLWKIIQTTPQIKLSEIGFNRGILLVYFSFYAMFILGVAISITAITKNEVMKITLLNGDSKTLPLSQIIRKKQLSNLIDFLDERINLKLSLAKDLS